MTRSTNALRSLSCISLLLLVLGCAAPLRAQNGAAAAPEPGAALATADLPGNGEAGIVVTTVNDTRVFFRDGWELTWDGIRGCASVQAPDGTLTVKDTTLSYSDATSASATGRGASTSQFALTLLGIILVIGLAALILYAAFLATDR
jgi:hypothetical protein